MYFEDKFGMNNKCICAWSHILKQAILAGFILTSCYSFLVKFKTVPKCTANGLSKRASPINFTLVSFFITIGHRKCHHLNFDLHSELDEVIH